MEIGSLTYEPPHRPLKPWQRFVLIAGVVLFAFVACAADTAQLAT